MPRQVTTSRKAPAKRAATRPPSTRVFISRLPLTAAPVFSDELAVGEIEVAAPVMPPVARIVSRPGRPARQSMAAIPASTEADVVAEMRAIRAHEARKELVRLAVRAAGGWGFTIPGLKRIGGSSA